MMNISKNYDQIDQWTSLVFLYSFALKEINVKVEILNNESVHIYNYNPIEYVKSRLKTPDSIVKKLKRYSYDITMENTTEKLSDIVGVRIICSLTSDIYQIADMVPRQSDVTVLHVKDYIKDPKSNDYRSYHIVVTIPIYPSDGPIRTKVEIQIRAVAIDFRTSLKHKVYYKSEDHASTYPQKELKACANVVDMLDTKICLLNEAILELNQDGQKEGEAPELAPSSIREKT